MRRSRYSNQSSSNSSEASTQHSSTNRHKSPLPSDYEYLGRLVTRERPIVRKSKSIHENLVFSQNKHQYDRAAESRHQEIYEDVTGQSSDDDIDNSDGLNKPVGVIRINDRHLREIYRLPTPPPTVTRVYHRLRSPETKVIERVFVRRPPPQIIENIIEIPPEKVRIINREKYLGKSKPITRSKLIHLKARQRQEAQEEQEQEQEPEQYTQQETYLPSEQYSQQQQQQQQQQPATSVPFMTSQQSATPVPLITAPQATTTLVYPPQPNMRTLGYIQSSVPPHLMFNSQQPLQIPNQQTTQTTSYMYAPQQTTSHQMVQPTSYTYPAQQMAPYGCTRF